MSTGPYEPNGHLTSCTCDEGGVVKAESLQPMPIPDDSLDIVCQVGLEFYRI